MERSLADGQHCTECHWRCMGAQHSAHIYVSNQPHWYIQQQIRDIRSPCKLRSIGVDCWTLAGTQTGSGCSCCASLATDIATSAKSRRNGRRPLILQARETSSLRCAVMPGQWQNTAAGMGPWTMNTQLGYNAPQYFIGCLESMHALHKSDQSMASTAS
jgi:hypothetical protein